jgi:pimeloyl-ACP methyl ester carboxylesterase
VLVTPIASNLRIWDPPSPPFDPQRYSYRQALNSAGYATLSIDLLGQGLSSHPFSALVTMDSSAFVVHQVISMLRTGALGGHAFGKVIADGWSNTLLLMALEDGRYHDVDALVLQGLPFPVTAELGTTTAQDLEPAAAEPKFAGMGLDPGYLTFKADFYQRFLTSPDDYDPAVIAAVLFDQDTGTAEYGAQFVLYYSMIASPMTSPTSAIAVPVLLGFGSEDKASCVPPGGIDCSTAATVRAANAPLYAKAPRLDTFVLPRSGHAMNLAFNAPDWFNEVVAFSNSVVGH